MPHTGKPRDEHRGQSVPHFGHDHFEKSELERAVPPDNGPAGHVTELARRAIEAGDNVSPAPKQLGNILMPAEPELADATDDLEGEQGVPRAG